jgi:hypothetical protein
LGVCHGIFLIAKPGFVSYSNMTPV